MQLVSGDKVGHYEITSLLGQGGMGEVYRGRDGKLGRDVAIKILPPAFAVDAGRMARFEREARVLASLNHQNIAHIYGVEDRALVMELVEGESPGGPLPFDDAWRIATQIADALEYAHERGVVHRDLKPANVKVTPEGVVKLLDFGLAKAYIDQPDSAAGGDPSMSPTMTLGATIAGTIIGTAAYMAPEQARGKNVDKRADIWSWGVVLYELITGDRLFLGEDAAETLAAVIHKEPDLGRVPPRARRLLASCLEKDPKKRLRDIGDARRMLDDTPSAAPPSNGQRSPWTAWALAGAFAVSSAAFAALWLRPAPPPAVTRFQIFAPPGGTLPLGVPAPSPDGRMVVYTVREHDGLVRLYVRSLDSTESRALPGTENAVHPFWSPDGRSVGFVSTNNMEIKRVDLDAGSARSLASTTGPWHGSWSQAGSQAGTILFQGGGGLAQIPAEGGSAAPVWKLDDKKGEISGGFPFFLSDGKRFLVTLRRNDGRDIELGSLGSTNRTMVLPNATGAAILAPTPDGKSHLLYLRDAALMAQEFDEKAGTVRGNPFLLVNGIGRVAATGSHPSVGVSPRGVLAYQTGGVDTNLMRLGWYDRSGKLLEELPPQTETWISNFLPTADL